MSYDPTAVLERMVRPSWRPWLTVVLLALVALAVLWDRGWIP